MNRLSRSSSPRLHQLSVALNNAYSAKFCRVNNCAPYTPPFRLILPTLLLSLVAPQLQAASAGGGRQNVDGIYAGVGGQGNGQGGAGGGFALPWNGSTISNNGQGSAGTDRGYVGNGSTYGLRGQGSDRGLQVNSSVSNLDSSTYHGGTAGDGQDGTGVDGSGGGGGGGGAGIAITADGLQVSSSALLIGGQGGAGGDGDKGGGGGGGGGAGLLASTSNSLVRVGNSITGGSGGSAGNFGGGGGGGDGLVLNGGGNTINSTATISGGIGGQRGAGATSSAQDGASGVGVRINGNGNTLASAGVINGGNSRDGRERANAVMITGNNNTIGLQEGSSFNGDVVVASGTGNRLLIGEGTADGTFDLASLVENLGNSYNGTRFAGFDILEKAGSTTWVLEGVNTYTGRTEVSAGSLIVGAAAGSSSNLSSDVRVADGAALGGHGRIIGNIELLAGSTLSPGNSIGTLRVNGDVTFDAASTLDIETNSDGSADKLIATGRVALNDATLNIIAGAGAWLPSTSYTIIEAGSVSGEFDQVSKNLVFLTPEVTYNQNTVVLTLNRNDTSFNSVGDTPNQRGTASAVDSLSASTPVASAVSVLDEEDAKRAFDSLSGEIHASTQAALLDDTRYLREGVNARMLAGQDLTNAQGILNDNSDGASFWLQGYGARATNESDGNAASVERNNQGLIFGGDLPLNAEWRVGAALSLGEGDIKDGRQSLVDVDSRSLALYASGQLNQFNLRVGVSRSWHELDSRRQLNIGALADNNAADYSATSNQLFAELGYRVNLNGLRMEPYVGLTHARLSTGAFKEAGGSTALSSEGQKQEINLSSLGLRVNAPLAQIAGLPLSAQGNLGWQHNFAPINADSQLSFSGSSIYRVESTKQERDSAVLETGIALGLSKSVSLDLLYSGRFGADLRDNSVRIGLSAAF